MEKAGGERHIDDLFFYCLTASFLAAGFVLSLGFVGAFSRNRYKPAAHKAWVRDSIPEIVLRTGWIFGTVPLILKFGRWGFGAAAAIYIAVMIINLPKAGAVFLARDKRLLGMQTVLLLTVAVLGILMKNSRNFYSMVYAIVSLSTPYIVMLANTINRPYENAVRKKEQTAAKRVLDSLPDLKVAVILCDCDTGYVTGILESLIGAFYRVLALTGCSSTDSITAAISERLSPDHQILLFGMPMRETGEWKKVCHMDRPDYSVIFLSDAETSDAKPREEFETAMRELADAMPPEGIIFYQADAEPTKSLRKTGDWIGFGMKNGDYITGEISVLGSGTKFTLRGTEFHTELIGKRCLTGIAAALAVALTLNILPQEMVEPVRRLKSKPGRLQLRKSGDNLIIDDRCGAKPEEALEALAEFHGFRLLVTPGIALTETKRDRENFRFGMQAAGIFDHVILYGGAQTLFVYNGLIAAGFSGEKIVTVKTRNEALIRAEGIDTHGKMRIILEENGLPD